MAKLQFFDPEHVERETPARPWSAIIAAAALLTLALTFGWEMLWRSKGLEPGDFNNTNGLWAEARRSVKPESTVMIGSSRILFDVNLNVWEAMTGVRPVQLALEGTSPRLFLNDLADDETFRGTVVVGVTAPLFFTSPGGLRATVLKYYKDESLAQRADHILSKQLERVFAFMDEQSRPKRQVSIWPMPLREGMQPRFDPRKLSAHEADRSARMWRRVEEDAVYQEEARQQWLTGFRVLARLGPDGKPLVMPDAAVTEVIVEVKASVDKIRARGGDVLFLRLPFDGPWAEVENGGFARERFWDRLIRETGSVGVSFQDHPELQGYDLPEWSHLSASEAIRYTKALVPIVERERAAGGR